MRDRIGDNIQLKFLRFWFPAFLYSGIIFYVSSIPNVKIPFNIACSDKIFHLFEYMPFGFLLARAFLLTEGSLSKKVILSLVILCSFLYGASDEFHQSFVVGRSACITDFLADTIGGFLGGYLYFMNLKRLT